MMQRGAPKDRIYLYHDHFNQGLIISQSTVFPLDRGFPLMACTNLWSQLKSQRLVAASTIIADDIDILDLNLLSKIVERVEGRE
jgi:hypothetical protein